MGCGCILKLIDAVLFLFFLLFAIVVPLLDAQHALPVEYYPKQLVDLNTWYANEYGDYLVSEKPHFFIGLIWIEIFLIWPVSVASLFALASGKSWYRTTCLIFGVSCITGTAATLGELLGSGRASDKLLMVYYPFLAVGVLATLRGLCPGGNSCATPVAKAKKHAVERKKKA